MTARIATIIALVLASLAACGESPDHGRTGKKCKLCSRPVEELPGRGGTTRTMSYCAGHALGNDGRCDKVGCRAPTQCYETDGSGSLDFCEEHVGMCMAEGCSEEAVVPGGSHLYPVYCIKCKVDGEERAMEARRLQLQREAEELEEQRRSAEALEEERRRRRR